MSLSNALGLLKREVPASSLFPVVSVHNTLFQTRNGALGAVIALDGVPFITASNQTVNQHADTLHQALLQLGAEWIVYVTVHRHKADVHLAGDFTSAFAKRLNDAYHARFQQQNLYQNDLYLTILLKGDTSTKTNRFIQWVNAIGGKQLEEWHQLQQHAQEQKITRTVQQLTTQLSAFTPHVLTDHDMLAFLALVPNGGEPYALPSPNMSVGGEGISPLSQNLGSSLCNHRLFFGQYIQFEGLSQRRFGSMLSVKKYPESTGSLILDPLLQVDSAYLATSTFAPLSRDAALDHIRIQRNKMTSAGDKGASQIEALTMLEDALASESSHLGYHHHTVMVLGDTVAEVESKLPELEKAYSYSGMQVVRETLGAEPAFWAQIPGNAHNIARAGLITSHNFADFCSLHNMPTGFYNENHLGSAVTLLETPSQTPVYFNFHTQGSSTNPAKGHTAIFGANDAGKTTMAAFLDAQLNRYGGRTFFIDRDMGLKIYVLAFGNSSYTVISPKYRDSLKMNPLQLPDSPESRSFLKHWMGCLLLQAHETILPSTITEKISDSIDYCYEQLDKPYRTLSHISRYFPHDFDRWPELRRWLACENGEYGWLFDNDTDALSFDFDRAGFDVTYLMDEVQSHIATPVYAYLVHRMRLCLDGRLTTFVIDEFQQVLRSPFWVEYLNAWLPTIRKKNGHFVLMTQSPQHVVASPICATVIDNMATSIFFPNPQADTDVYCKALKLTPSEYQMIQENNPRSRCFLYKQGHTSIWCKLDLSALGDSMRVLSGNTKTALLLDHIIAEYGNKPENWLPVFLERSKS